MKLQIASFLLFVIILSLIITEANCKNKPQASKEAKKKMDIELYKQIFLEKSKWNYSKNIKLKTFAEDKYVTIFEDNKIVNKQKIVYPYHQSVAEFNIQAIRDEETGKPLMLLNDLVIEFVPEDPSALELEIGYNNKVPTVIQDFIPRQKFMDQQIKLIQERGLLNRHKFTKNTDHPAPSDLHKEKNVNKDAYILMICKKDEGKYNIKASIYPYLLGDKKENKIEFTFQKDCNYKKTNPHLEIDISHYSSIHNINEFSNVWKDDKYTDAYKYGDFRNGILIDTVDPQIQIKIAKGSQFVLNPQIKKISGKPSTNIVQLKKNVFGGLIIGPYRNLDIYVISKCKDEVGEEKWEFTMDFPPYDQEISFIFKTLCGKEQLIEDYTQLPLLIGTDEQEGNVFQFGIVNQNFELDQQLIDAGNKPKIYEQKDREVQFQYSLQPSDPQDETLIQVSSPILTYDDSVVKIFYQFPMKGEIDIEQSPQLKIKMRCQKVGQTNIEIYQTVDVVDKGIKKYPIEYGFTKVCTGFDYDYDNRSKLKTESPLFDIVKYSILLISAILLFFALKLVLPGGSKRIQLPTKNIQYSTELQGKIKEEGAVQRKRLEN